jgi:hypothetical protein
MRCVLYFGVAQAKLRGSEKFGLSSRAGWENMTEVPRAGLCTATPAPILVG